MNLEDLKTPFPAEAISWRVGATNGDKTQGIALAYIDARDVMDRLDKVCGPAHWQCRYPQQGLCEIGIFVEAEWVWKANGADTTDVEGVKGQYSDSFKRAAVLWGIGRYLYSLPNVWVPLKARGRSYVIETPPKLPQWALPGGSQGLPQGAGVDTAVNIERMTDVLTQAKDVVVEYESDPEQGAIKAKEIYQPLDKPERMWLAGQMGKVKHGRRSFWTTFHEFLKHAPVE